MPGSFCRQLLFFLCAWDPGIVDGPTRLSTSSPTCSSPGSLTPVTSCLFFLLQSLPSFAVGHPRLWLPLTLATLVTLVAPVVSDRPRVFFFTTVFTPVRCQPQIFNLISSSPPSLPSFPTRSLLLHAVKSSARSSAQPQHPTPTPPLAVGLSRVFDAVRSIAPASCPRYSLHLPSSSPYISPVPTAVED